jgi:hypothetical protein
VNKIYQEMADAIAAEPESKKPSPPLNLIALVTWFESHRRLCYSGKGDVMSYDQYIHWLSATDWYVSTGIFKNNKYTGDRYPIASSNTATEGRHYLYLSNGTSIPSVLQEGECFLEMRFSILSDSSNFKYFTKRALSIPKGFIGVYNSKDIITVLPLTAITARRLLKKFLDKQSI